MHITTRLVAGLALPAALLTACQSEPTSMSRPPEVVAEVSPGLEAPPPQGRRNADWDRINKHFLGRFTLARAADLRDPFSPRLHTHIDMAALEAQAALEIVSKKEGSAPPPIQEPVVLLPSQRYPLRDYRILAIRWGTSVNRVLVEDPAGRVFSLTTDEKLGNGNGHITDITEYEVYVQQDRDTKPVVLSVRPEILVSQAEAY